MKQHREGIVIFVGPFFPKVGGMERFAEDLALGLHKLGHRVSVVTKTVGAGHDPERFPFPVIRVSHLHELRPHFAQAGLVLFVGLTFREVRFANALKCHVLLTHHGEYLPTGVSPRGRLAGLIKRQLCRFHKNVSVSQYLVGRLPGKHAVVPNSFRTDVFFDANEKREPLSFAFVGRLVSDKGCGLLIRAFAKLLASHPEARLRVIGSGSELERLLALTHQLGCGRAMTFTGSLDAPLVAAILRKTECLVVPSTWNEPFGIVALEGLACGCEVIVTNRGGLPEAVADFGWKVEPAVEPIFEAMLKVASGARLRREPEVHDFLGHRTSQQMALRYQALINDVLEEEL